MAAHLCPHLKQVAIQKINRTIVDNCSLSASSAELLSQLKGGFAMTLIIRLLCYTSVRLAPLFAIMARPSYRAKARAEFNFLFLSGDAMCPPSINRINVDSEIEFQIGLDVI